MKKHSFAEALRLGIRLLLRGRFTLTFDQLEFEQSNLPVRKRLNLLIQGAQVLLRPIQRIGFPLILQIEPSNVCNLRCLACPTGTKLMTRPPEFMSFEMFCHIIDQLKDYVYLVVFWSWGEPFMNKDAFRMIRYAKNQGLLVHSSTNGHFFHTRERAKQLIWCGLDSLVVAADGLDQPTYEKYRERGKLELVIKSIENVLAERLIAGVSRPRLVFRFLVMKHNEHQVEQVKAFGKRLGMDVVTFRSAVLERGKLNLENRLAPDSERFQQFSYKGSPSVDNRVKHGRTYCHRPFANLTIFSNGDVVLCENDFNASEKLGNVAKQDLRDVLSSPRFRGFLKTFRRDLTQIPFCETCEIRDMKRLTHNLETHVLRQAVGQ